MPWFHQGTDCVTIYSSSVPLPLSCKDLEDILCSSTLQTLIFEIEDCKKKISEMSSPRLACTLLTQLGECSTSSLHITH